VEKLLSSRTSEIKIEGVGILQVQLNGSNHDKIGSACRQ